MSKDGLYGVAFSEAISAGTEVLKSIINELIEEFRPTMTLDDLQRVYTKTIDKVIFHEEDKSNSRYVGGEFNLDYVSERAYTCGYKLFFRDEQKKIFALEAKSKELSISKLHSSVREQLKTDKNIKFEIPEPDESARDKHNRETFNQF